MCLLLQMNAGIILSFFNQRYFADTLSTVCEFIPQVCGQGLSMAGPSTPREWSLRWLRG